MYANVKYLISSNKAGAKKTNKLQHSFKGKHLRYYQKRKKTFCLGNNLKKEKKMSL